MARIKGGMNAKKKHNRVLKLAKGYRAVSYTHLIEAEAKDEGISVKEYKKQYQYTDEKLDEEYTYNVKSELVMWQLVKDLGFEASDDEIEEMYENCLLYTSRIN